MYSSKKKFRPTLRMANNLMTAVIVSINLYIIALPILPQFKLWRDKRGAIATAGIPYKTNLSGEQDKNDKRTETPKDNRVIIPKLALNEFIYEGSSPYLVNKGVWARPKTSTPDKGSNTVLVGHRFTYDGPATFYHLDKVIAGDKVIIFWHGVEYDYEVTGSKIVAPTAVEVEAPTSEPTLTIYTCTPLWTAKNRLVLTTKLLNPEVLKTKELETKQ